MATNIFTSTLSRLIKLCFSLLQYCQEAKGTFGSASSIFACRRLRAKNPKMMFFSSNDPGLCPSDPSLTSSSTGLPPNLTLSILSLLPSEKQTSTRRLFFCVCVVAVLVAAVDVLTVGQSLLSQKPTRGLVDGLCGGGR